MEPETPAEKTEAAQGTEPTPQIVPPTLGPPPLPALSWIARFRRWLISKIYVPIPVDPSALVYFGIRELRIGNVYLETMPHEGEWKLHENLKVTWVDLDGKQEVEFQAGLETDLASIPRLLWRVIPPIS